MAKLKPPLNYRTKYPRVCAFCVYLCWGEAGGYCNCARPNGPEFDAGDGKYYYLTCDRGKWDV